MTPNRTITQTLAALSWFLMLSLTAGCADVAPASDVSATSSAVIEVSDDVGEIELKTRRSLLVTHLAGIERVARDHELGHLLAELGQEVISLGLSRDETPQFGLTEIDHWVRTPFARARAGYDRHNTLSFRGRVGLAQEHNPYRHLLDLWPGVDAMPVGPGPFRLLAVVNRMDMTGDFDARGNLAARDPKALGEGRLVFGLVDPTYEATHGEPYPMTFIIEYRLPALTANYFVKEDFDYREDMFNRQKWRTQMKRWANVWRELSRWDPKSSDPEERAAFAAHLNKIVRRFARPENFIALRSNAELQNDKGVKQYELREWYVLLQDQWNLIPRKLRDEPYQCGDNADVAALVDNYWNDDLGDLDLHRTLDDIDNKTQSNSGGYHVPRDVSHAPLPVSNPIVGCPTDGEGVPVKHAMVNDDPPDISNVLTPFGRAKEDRVWELTGSPEPQRHAFAIRTCTGCHGKEAGVFGFHIFPRLEGDMSKLSRFLTRQAGRPTEFSHGGASYRYDELQDRAGWLERASAHDPTMELFETLYRNDQD